MPFLGKGSYGCVFSPALKCKDTTSKKYPEDSIGKIFAIDHDYEEEKELNESFISNIDPKSKWTVPYYGNCKTDLRKAEEADNVYDCDSVKGDEVKDQLIFQYGGISLRELCNNKNDYYDIYIDDIILMMLPLLKGLKELDKNSLIHCDIKPDNCLYNEKTQKLYLIDFGMMKKSDNIFTIEREDLLKKDHLYYPPEFKLYYLWVLKEGFSDDGKEFNVVKRNISTNTITSPLLFKKAISKYIPNYDHEKITKTFIEKTNSNRALFIKKCEEEYISKIDVYSLGISFFYLLFRRTDLNVRDKDFVNEALNQVFVNMINPDPDLRYTPSIAVKGLTNIIKKFRLSKKDITSGVSVSSSPEKLTQEDCEKMKVTQIRELLKKAGKATYGNKKTLCERLLST